MKYPLNNPRKDLDLQVLSLHLRPITRKKSTRNGLDKMNPHSGQTIELDGRRKATVRHPAKPRTTPKSKSQQELEYEKLLKKYFKRKGRSKNRNKLRRPSKVREQKAMQEKEGEEYKEVKRQNLRSRRIHLFSRSEREKQPKGKRPSMSRKVKPAHEEFQRTELPGNWVDVGQLALPPMLDGEMLDEEKPLTYNQLGGENYYNTQQGDILQKADEKIMQEKAIWDGSKDQHVLLGHDRHRKLKSLQSGGEEKSREPSLTEDHQEITQSSLGTMANTYFHTFPGAEETSVLLLPTRNGVRDDELPQDNQKLWRKVVPAKTIPIIDIYSDTIHPVAIHDGPHKAEHQHEMLLLAEGSGRDKMGLEQEDKIVTFIPNKGSAQTPQVTQEVSLSQPTATIQKSSYNPSLSPTSGNYTEVPRVTESEQLLDGKFSPLEATMKHNPGPIYCKPGYEESGGVCKNQCEVGGMNCGSNGQCVIVENIGPMCRCQQMNSLCYGGECCRSSLTTFQLACVLGGCWILLSVFLGSLPFLIRKVDIKTIAKSVRTRLWISTLMPHSSTSLSSQSADLTVCSDYESAPDLSTLYRANKMTFNSTMLQCERTWL
ncbi:uncharacterized protein LOC130297056 isoform X2 [Hyla sarda]|uniref:uncharacterized protein LOC130297056 isoform X2 n=1 Tax=Hyla sarda TaxID=327740 RepID=UPI0024C39BB6|nr:uncharacterized protein LOC130297056 isoform X2 [Hyla sarda]